MAYLTHGKQACILFGKLSFLAFFALIFLTFNAQAQQFNTNDGSNYDETDSAFQINWDDSNDRMQFNCAASGSAGAAIFL